MTVEIAPQNVGQIYKHICEHICERKRTNSGRELTNYLLTETLFLPKALLEENE